VPELLTSMEDKLRHGVQLLSSFDKYRKELLSGRLEWGPTHTSESFWRKNVDKFEEREFFVLRTLLKLVETSQEVCVYLYVCVSIVCGWVYIHVG